jgi:hypothetical protein
MRAHTRRVIVDRERFTAAAARRRLPCSATTSVTTESRIRNNLSVTCLYGDDPRNSFDYSWVISAREVSRLSALIDPAKIISGGYPIPSRASRDQKTIDRFIGELSYGGGAVNQVNIHLFIESMPFGGVGPSGVDHYYGKHGFDMLTHAKTMPAPQPALRHICARGSLSRSSTHQSGRLRAPRLAPSASVCTRYRRLALSCLFAKAI